MAEAHHRKKNPQHVRAALIEGAAGIIVEQGLSAVSVQSVADAARVTKGGFFHHFPSKQALLDGLFEWLLIDFDKVLDGLMATDPEPYGRFTRAYVRTVFDNDEPGFDWGKLWIATLSDPELKHKWKDWYEARLEQHKATDTGAVLEAVRLTVDGIWLAELAGVAVQYSEDIRAALLAATCKP